MKQTRFKRKEEYRAPEGSESESKVEAVQEDVLDWTVRSFFRSLLQLSSDELTMEQVRENFKLVVEQVKQCPVDEQEFILKQVDMYVGRVRINLEGVLREWYAAFRSRK